MTQNYLYNNNSTLQTRTEDQEIYISGFMNLPPDCDLVTLSLAIIRGIDQSVNRNDILGVRLAYTRNNNGLQVSSKYPSIIPRLSSSCLVKKISSA